MALKQANRQLTVETPLGEDVLVLTAFAGREEISRLFSFRPGLHFRQRGHFGRQIVGKNGRSASCWPTARPAVSTATSAASSRATKISMSGAITAPKSSLALVPHADFRLPHLPEQEAPEIIEKIFKDLGFSDFKAASSAAIIPSATTACSTAKPTSTSSRD